MGRGTTRRPKRKERGGPSLFFIIALAVGIAVLVVVFFQMNRRPVVRHGMVRGVIAGAIRAAITT